MKKAVFILPAIFAVAVNVNAQDVKAKDVPSVVKEALAKKYPKAIKVSWEKEKGNYEANWGGKSGEDTSIHFTPAGAFVEEMNAISVHRLPAEVAQYVKLHYNGAKIREAGKITGASGKHFFQAEIKGKDLIFDEGGKFVKVD